MPITKENTKPNVGCIALSSPVALYQFRLKFEYPSKVPVESGELRTFLDDQKRILNSILNNLKKTHEAVGKEICKQEGLTYPFRFLPEVRKVKGFPVVEWYKFVSYGVPGTKQHEQEKTKATKTQMIKAKYISDWELELCKFLFEELSPIENYITQLIELSARLSTLDSTVKKTNKSLAA